MTILSPETLLLVLCQWSIADMQVTPVPNQPKNAEILAHYANMPMQYTAIFHGCINVNFQKKNYNIFSFLLKTVIVGTH